MLQGHADTVQLQCAVAVSGRRRDLTQDTRRRVLELFQVAWRASPPESYDVAPSVTGTAVSRPDILRTEVKDLPPSGHQEKQKLEQIPAESGACVLLGLQRTVSSRF